MGRPQQLPTKEFATAESTLAAKQRASSITPKIYRTASYSRTRPFPGRGKNQAALDTPRRPLTIDEVRELLNKNK